MFPLATPVFTGFSARGYQKRTIKPKQKSLVSKINSKN
jgi:hypothetical protein